ncbi:MAG: hypothetical protein L0Y35_05530 [Flammeovirgaceae bacterium]|nr:hypothetical protein [Flammeovirgaceae bacterium]
MCAFFEPERIERVVFVFFTRLAKIAARYELQAASLRRKLSLELAA